MEKELYEKRITAFQDILIKYIDQILVLFDNADTPKAQFLISLKKDMIQLKFRVEKRLSIIDVNDLDVILQKILKYPEMFNNYNPFDLSQEPVSIQERWRTFSSMTQHIITPQLKQLLEIIQKT